MMKGNTRNTTLTPWLVLGLISLPVFIGSLDLTIVSAFLPDIVLKLGLPPQSTLDDAAWVISGYLLAYAISMTFMGRVSDLIGRRKVYIACLVVFIVGSILVATAHLWPTDFLYTIFRRLGQRPERELVNLLAIIIGRVVQALGAGALVPVSLALVGDLFPPERRAQPLGVIGAVDTLGWVLGHLYGGVLVNFFAAHTDGFTSLLAGLGLNWPPPDWRTLFWINVPLTLVALALTLRALRNVPEQKATGRFDFLGTLLIGATLVGLVVGLGGKVDAATAPTTLDAVNSPPPFNGVALFIGLLCFLGFILIERRIKDPLIQLKLFRRRNLSSGSLVNLAVGFCLMIGLVSVPILINVRAQDASQLAAAALETGVLLSALTLPMALAAVPGGWLSDRIGYQRTTVIGLGLAIVGFGLIWRTWTIDLPDGSIALEMLLVGVGLGLTFSPISAAVINAADEDNRGVASALVIILRLIGMTIAVSSLTTLALQRVNLLASAQIAVTVPAPDPTQVAVIYADITASVLAELGLVGALVSAVALIPAFVGLRNDQDTPSTAIGGEAAASMTGD
jgi:MFS transporter, DHA2 family, triacylglyceride efflux pump